MTVLTQRFFLRGVHFLFDEKYNEPKHGHEYELLVSVKTDVDRTQLEKTVQSEILDKWDKTDFMHKDLKQASGELLVEEFDRALRSSQIGDSLVAIVLKETRKNRFLSAKSLLLCE